MYMYSLTFSVFSLQVQHSFREMNHISRKHDIYSQTHSTSDDVMATFDDPLTSNATSNKPLTSPVYIPLHTFSPTICTTKMITSDINDKVDGDVAEENKNMLDE